MGSPGRPSSLTPEVQHRICQALEAGNFRQIAAQWAGVPLRTFYDWMQQGKKKPDSPQGEFRRAVIEAEKAAEVRAVGLIMRAAQTDPKHAEWWLSHRWPDRWADKARKMERLQVNINDARESHALDKVNPERLLEIVGADTTH